jgi:NMD protein affecting ribosome stability and mRNA decay
MTEQQKTTRTCLSCGKSEEEIPLVLLCYVSREAHVCPQCLPVLIHHTDRLAERLAKLAAE